VSILRETISITPPPEEAAPRGGAYLLVLGAQSATRFPLPPSGEVLIGRAPEAQLCLPEPSISRHHARLVVAEGEIRLEDLGSHNGTRIDGERLHGPRTLLLGDVIMLGDVTLVLHREAPPGRRVPSALGPAEMQAHLETEIERALRYQRPLALVCLGFGQTETRLPLDRPRVLAALAPELRRMDEVCFLGQAELLVLLPELDGDEARAAAERLLRCLAWTGAVRAGQASCPLDACDSEALMAAARAAARVARPGAVADPSSVVHTREVEGRTLIVADPAMERLYVLLEKLAPTDLPVLLWGETGVGKEVAARALHAWSRRHDRPLVTLNCAAIPENLFESELFGYEKGAFSGAGAARRGYLESAHTGTLFLDEVGEMPLAIQAKLLRVLESQRFARLGDVRERSVDVRLVAATNRNLEEEVKAGRFRMDLLFRLGAAKVLVPPLRDRRRELPVLARSLLQAACEKVGRPPLSLTPLAMRRLLAHAWPGNVRELRNAMEYVAATAEGEALWPWHLPETIAAQAEEVGEAEAGAAVAGTTSEEAPSIEKGGSTGATAGPEALPVFRPIEDELRELERTRMLQALAAAGGVHRRAAELIGMPRRTFATKYKLYDLASTAVARRSG
jgi:DNA-binding NtrC family response regulator